MEEGRPLIYLNTGRRHINLPSEAVLVLFLMATNITFQFLRLEHTGYLFKAVNDSVSVPR
jgi:hypothetical protein